MKMAKPSKRDIDAALNLMNILDRLSNDEHLTDDDEYFDQDDVTQLRKLYDSLIKLLDEAPGFHGRVIGGMCFVIMNEKNEVIDPDSDVIEFHPRIRRLLQKDEQ
jgi:hypothetical protein